MNDHEAFRRPEGDEPARPRRGVVEDAPQSPPRRGFAEPESETHKQSRPLRGIDPDPEPQPTPTARPGRGARVETAPGPVDELADETARTPSRGRVGKILALLLTLLLLVLGGWWWSRHDASPTALVSPAPSTSTAVSASAAPKPAVEPSVTPAAAPAAPIEVPGPGTVDGVRRHLVALGFSCAQEKRPAMESWLCTRYDKDPAMFAYVGGASGHRLGRVSLNVQSVGGTRSTEALGLQTWIAQQALPATEAAKVTKALASGTAVRYATATSGPVSARGSGDGSIVLYVDGWLPSTALPADLLPAKPFVPTLTARGYTCSASTCTRSSGGLEYTVDYRVKGLGVTHLKVKVTSSGTPLVTPALSETKSVVKIFQEGPELAAWLDRHAEDRAGATGFADGTLFVDWYPGSSLPGNQSSVFYVRQSCWSDAVESC